METDLGEVVKKELQENTVEIKGKCDKYVFTDCRNVKPKEIQIWTKPKSSDWQVGFFDADSEVYFDKIEIGFFACFSSIVKNYWQNGKEGEEKKECYYSLIKSVKQLKIYNEQAVNDLVDYVEGWYEAGEHWQIHELDRNIELKIDIEVEETTVERLSKYFDNIQCCSITTDFKTENNIKFNYNWYCFKNCEVVVPRKLIINAVVKHIDFHDADNEVHIPEVVMEEKADLRSIIQNKCRGSERYSLLLFVQVLIIRNNFQVLYDLANYINGRYKTYHGWKLHQLNKNMKIIVQKPAMVFGAIKEISDYFSDVLVDNQQAKDYVCKYISKFQEQFGKHGLETDLVHDFILADDYLELGDQKLNVGASNKRICKLTVEQRIAQQQFVCFHDTDEPVVIDKIGIKNDGDLRCVLQNAYYNGMNSGFFSLLQTAKELEVHSNQSRDHQVLIDLADYIEGKYALNTNWKQEELDKNIRIIINSGKYSLSLNITRRLRKYFRNVSIDRIWTRLETKNVIDQECEDMYIFAGSREANPQKLVINGKLMGSGTLILFNGADNEVNVPDITISEQGCFAVIVRNHWQNNKDGDEEKYGYYSLIQHLEMLTIRNNPEALKDLADYAVGKYEIRYSSWKLQQLSKDIKVVIEESQDTFLPVSRIQSCFVDVAVDGGKPEEYLAAWGPWNNPDYKTFVNCFKAYGLVVDPPECPVDAARELVLEDCYNIRGPVDSIDLLTIRQKVGINQIVCFHDTDKPVVIDKIVIEGGGDLRCVLQNACYNGMDAGFFSLLETAKNLEIRNSKQAAEDLADYVDGKYALHPKWEKYVMDRNMEIKLHHDKYAFSLDVAIRLRSYFVSVSIDCIWVPLETENVIDQECEDKYIFGDCRDANPQTLVVNAKLAGDLSLIMFNGADGEVCIPEVMISENGSFDTIVRNKWRNCKNDSESKYGYYSLVSHVKTLIIQSNPQAVRDLDNYVSRNYWIRNRNWKVQRLNKNAIVRINSVSGLDEEINRLKEYFGYIFVDGRKSLRDGRQQMLAHINQKSNDIRQRQAQNKKKHQSVDNSVTSIQDTKQRIERARARLGRRRAHFQEYLALAE